jgi:ribonuclease HI
VRNLTLYFDGSCWPNPGGTAAYGFTLYDGPTKLADGHGVIDTSPAMSNNVAEFYSLYQGLSALSSDMFPVHITVKGDSQLVINVMNNRWHPKSDKLYYPEWRKVQNLVKELRWHGCQFTFQWIPREQNIEADDLSKVHLNPVA